jgi:hypothetical protein
VGVVLHLINLDPVKRLASGRLKQWRAACGHLHCPSRVGYRQRSTEGRQGGIVKFSHLRWNGGVKLTGHYDGYRFPIDVIGRAVWMYFRYCLSYRDARAAERFFRKILKAENLHQDHFRDDRHTLSAPNHRCKSTPAAAPDPPNKVEPPLVLWPWPDESDAVPDQLPK